MSTKKAPEKAASAKKPVQPAAAAAQAQPAEPKPHHLRVLALQTENVKRISLVRVRPKKNMVIVSGENGSGKTSLLDSLAYAIMGERGMPSQPIRKGQQSARIQVDLGDLKVTRTFTRINGGKEPYMTTLSIEGKNREKYPSPQSILDKLKGVISFDPLAFTNMDDRKQLETLRKLVKFDVDLDAIEAAKKQAYDARRDAGREIDGAKARLQKALPPIENLPEKLIDTGEITHKLEGAANANNVRLSLLQKKTGLESLADQGSKTGAFLRDEAEGLRKRIAELEKGAAAADSASAQNSQLAAAVVIPAEVDTAALAHELREAQTTNNNIRIRDQYRAIEREIAGKEAEWTALDAEVKAKEKEREDALARAKMPIDKLSIGEDEILYDGLPLRQSSNGEQIRVAVAMAMASSPELRVLRIMDGALLDDKTMAMIEQMANEHDFQVWVERVDTTGKVGIVMVDGEASGEEVEAVK